MQLKIKRKVGEENKLFKKPGGNTHAPIYIHIYIYISMTARRVDDGSPPTSARGAAQTFGVVKRSENTLVGKFMNGMKVKTKPPI